MVFKNIRKYGDHEQVVFCNDRKTGLKAIIAIHDTRLGPALGGTRMWNYSSEEEALTDVLRLSEGMTYKAAAAGLSLGGGKAVIIGDPKKDKSEGLFRSFGLFINSLNGRYITAEDVGTTVNDMENIYMETSWVTGISEELGGSGDPSPYTAHGVLMAIRASCKEKLGTDSLKGIGVAIQGLGHVGSNLVKYLAEQGVRLVVADIDSKKVDSVSGKYQCQVSDPETIHTVECDVFAPCAMGAILNDESIPQLKCKIVAGGANNVLAEVRHGDTLREMGILYAPDFVANSGGLMNVFIEMEGYSVERALEKTNSVYDNIMNVFEVSRKMNCSTHAAALKIASDRLETIIHSGNRHSDQISGLLNRTRKFHN